MLPPEHQETILMEDMGFQFPSQSVSIQSFLGKNLDINKLILTEMRGNGDYGNFGFMLPPRFIKPNVEEVFAGFIALIHEARDFGRFPIN